MEESASEDNEFLMRSGPVESMGGRLHCQGWRTWEQDFFSKVD